MRRDSQEMALGAARSFFEQLILTRKWAALHGGVFVPATPETPPNPYLKPEGRDFVAAEGTAYTKLNPAYLTRQLSDLSERQRGVTFRITSLKPLRPENAPNDWERAALTRFDRGEREVHEFLGNAFFYMAALETEPECLACHAHQGYRAGDVRGGIRIAIPHMNRFDPTLLILGHLALGFVGAGLIAFFGLRLVSAYEHLSLQAMHDPLTQLPNRRYFFERYVEELRRTQRSGAPLAVLMCDIDHFKAYNDHYGHLAGDECLKSVAGALAGRIRRGGDMAARYGGEEFIVLLPDTDAVGAREIAQGLCEAVRALAIPHAQSQAASVVTLSVGVAVLDREKDIAETALIDHADLALYRSKALGRNQVVFFDPKG